MNAVSVAARFRNDIASHFASPETKFHVKPLPHARIPIVKLSLDPSPGLPLGIACDIGFENRLALENTRLLMCYAMIDPARVRTLVLFREFTLCPPPSAHSNHRAYSESLE